MLTTVLSVTLGFLLIILFYSLLATGIMELIASAFALRGKYFLRVLQGLVSPGQPDQRLYTAFIKEPLFRQLSGYYYGKKQPPSYLDAGSFREILLRVIDKQVEGNSFREKVENLDDSPLQQLLRYALEDQRTSIAEVGQNIEGWYEKVWARATGMYTRRTRGILVGLGFVIAVTFNVDAIALFRQLVDSAHADSASLANLAAVVQQMEATPPPIDSSMLGSDPTTLSIRQDLLASLRGNIREMNDDPLGIGWFSADTATESTSFFWPFRLFGWLITAVCISLGASFWFDLLNKIIRFRGTGTRPLLGDVDTTREWDARNGEFIARPVG